MKKIFNIFTYISIIVSILFVFYISWILWFLETIIALTIYGSIFYLFHILWIKFKNKLKWKSKKNDESKIIEIKTYKNYLIYFYKRVVNILMIFWIILYWFWYYQNTISPALMPTYTLTNWVKTVIFQWMSHIWSKDFYENIKNNLIEKKKQDYVYYFEWVKSWTKENHKKFNDAIWIQFDKSLYKNFSELYWVIYQDNSIYYWLVNDKDFNVDLSIDEIIKLYEKNSIKSENNEANQTKLPIDINTEIIKFLSSLTENQKKVLIFVNQSILNLIIKNNDFQDYIKDNFANKELFKIILEERNKVLSKKIINSTDNKIFITYWLMHFKWVFKLLKENDNKWKIINTDYLIPIR